MAVCQVCFHHCKLTEGQTGLCLARACRDGAVVPVNYGRVTSLALDPIEKKPLYRFYPGSRILSAGSFGCNLRCPFCQNYEISYSEYVPGVRAGAHCLSPTEVVDAAVKVKPQGNIGIAFTYNEPLVGYEFVRDTARLAKEADLKTVVVTNGTASVFVLEELLPYIDAMNIDLKAFTERFYTELIHGDLAMTKAFLTRAAEKIHVEVTTLIIPGENDSDEEMEELTGFLADLNGGSGNEIPLHITRFFPRYQMTDREATPVETIFRLTETAKKKLRYVYPGNVPAGASGGANR